MAKPSTAKKAKSTKKAKSRKTAARFGRPPVPPEKAKVYVGKTDFDSGTNDALLAELEKRGTSRSHFIRTTVIEKLRGLGYDLPEDDG